LFLTFASSDEHTGGRHAPQRDLRLHLQTCAATLAKRGQKVKQKKGLKLLGKMTDVVTCCGNKPAAHFFPPQAVFKKGQGNAR
jgi:hypothetical protein